MTRRTRCRLLHSVDEITENFYLFKSDGLFCACIAYGDRTWTLTAGRQPDSYTSAGLGALRRSLMKIVALLLHRMGDRNLSRSICRSTMRRPTLWRYLHRSAILPAQSTMVTEMPEGFYQDWHPASGRQLLIVLSGTLEVETSDGKNPMRQR